MSIDNYSIDIKKGKRALVHIDSYRIHSGVVTFLFRESVNR